MCFFRSMLPLFGSLASQDYFGMPYPEKEEVRTLLRQDPASWKNRPLSEVMIRAATDDVRFLLNIHEKMMEKLSKVSSWRLSVRNELYCRCFCINDNQQADWPPLPTVADDIEAEARVPKVDILSLLDVPPRKMGCVIGRKGSSIIAVKESCNVEIHIVGAKGPPGAEATAEGCPKAGGYFEKLRSGARRRT